MNERVTGYTAIDMRLRVRVAGPAPRAEAPAHTSHHHELSLRFEASRRSARADVCRRVTVCRYFFKVEGAWSRAAYLPSGVKSWPARPSTELCPQFLHGRAGPRPYQPPAPKSAVPTRATLTRTNR